jgi:DNA-binding NtrC family response regulator
VLIVEQDLDIGLKLADLLATHGYQPVLVRSVDVAIGQLSAIRPRAIFVGLRSAEPQSQMNVGEVLLIIQTLCPFVPATTIAGRISEDLTQVVLRHSARRFVVKPVEFSQAGEVLTSEPSETAIEVDSYGA